MNRQTLHVTVEEVRYPRNKEQATLPCFQILSCRTEQGESFLAKGELPNFPSRGTRLNLNGCWSAWNGQRQFKFFTASEDLPVDERGMLRYACELSAGFGVATEEKIWDLKKEAWRELAAGEIPGITEAKIAIFRETINRLALEAEKSNVIVWLVNVGCTMRMAEAAWEKWKLETVGVIQANCYELAWLDGFSFADVDNHIRRGFNISDTDERRVNAAIKYCIDLLQSNGDNLLDWNTLSEELQKKLPNVPMTVLVDGVAKMFRGKELVSFGLENGGLLARWQDFEDDRMIWEFANG